MVVVVVLRVEIEMEMKSRSSTWLDRDRDGQSTLPYPTRPNSLTQSNPAHSVLMPMPMSMLVYEMPMQLNAAELS